MSGTVLNEPNSSVLQTGTGIAVVQPKQGTAAQGIVQPRQYPWACVVRGTIRAAGGGATVAQGMAAMLCQGAGNRCAFGLKGAVDQVNYSLWVEDNSGTVLNSATTTIPALFDDQLNEDWCVIYDGGAIEAWYAIDDGTPVLAATLANVENIPLGNGGNLGHFKGATAGGTEQTWIGAILGVTVGAR